MKQIVALAFVLFSNNLFACRCDFFPAFSKTDIDKADYISLVKIKKILPLKDPEFSHNPNRQQYFEILVEEKCVYKGDKLKKIIVNGGHPKFNTWTSCDYDMNENEEWLIFGRQEKGKIVVNSCTRTARFIQHPAPNDFRSQQVLTHIKFLDDFYDKINPKREE